MEIWPWAFIIGIKIISLRPIIKYSNSKYYLAPPPINQSDIHYKPLPIFTPQKSQQNTRVFC